MGSPVNADFFEKSMQSIDVDVKSAIDHELKRQQGQIELIASENIVSKAVMEAQGSVLTNKYAEGYPGKRYYGGCEHVDVVERIAIERAKNLFDCGYANVQPHSGRSGQPKRYVGFDQTRSHNFGYGFGLGWPPNARRETKYVRKVVQCDPIWSAT